MRLFTLLFLLITLGSSATINKSTYFSVFESHSISRIEAQIVSIKKEKASTDKDAFLGAMIMKKAQFMKTPKEKIAVFKEGKMLLENAIRKRPGKTTYRFLRLAIQENCPKILKYNTKIEEDKKNVMQNLSSLDNATKTAVVSYFKK
ncbi:MAG TPA: hypothetical protein EYG86_02240 [Crocinitomicaceae bacterium]|nr:hypothetical protein [Crocinitomicaceae bacterium]